MKALAVGLLLCLTLAACSSGSAEPADPDGAGASPTDMVPVPGAPPVPHEVPIDQSGTAFRPEPALVMAQSTPFEAWTPLPGNRIAVHFVTGSPECYGADATVAETERDVTITVRTGRLASAQDKTCIMIAVLSLIHI